jgi:hypothetical protein
LLRCSTVWRVQDRGIRVVGAAVVLAVGLAACSGKGAEKKETTRTTARVGTTVDPAGQYLALANPANEAAEKFNDAAKRLLAKTATQAQVAVEAAAFAKALEDMNKGLAAASWPPSVAALVPDLIRANTKVIADLRRAGTVAESELAAWNHEVAVDEGAFTEVAAKIRVELRLPPAEA